MSIGITRGKSDAVIERIIGALQRYESDHPRAKVDLFRADVVSVHIRIIDPDFAGMPRVARHKLVWSYLDALPEEATEDVSMLVLITPDEIPKSAANLDFDEPIPSII